MNTKKYLFTFMFLFVFVNLGFAQSGGDTVNRAQSLSQYNVGDATQHYELYDITHRRGTPFIFGALDRINSITMFHESTAPHSAPIPQIQPYMVNAAGVATFYRSVTQTNVIYPPDPGSSSYGRRSAQIVFSSTHGDSNVDPHGGMNIFTSPIPTLGAKKAMFLIGNTTNVTAVGTEISAASFSAAIVDGTYGVFGTTWSGTLYNSTGTSIYPPAAEPYIQLGTDIDQYGLYELNTEPFRKLLILKVNAQSSIGDRVTIDRAQIIFDYN